MCGRFTQDARSLATQQLAGELGADSMPAALPGPRYNLAPTQPALALVRQSSKDGPHVRGQLGRFGFSIGGNVGLVLNARSETLSQKRTFKPLLAWHRCLVLATGFYEWQPAQEGSKLKTPFYFRRADAAPFCFAALRAHTEHAEGADSGEPERGFVIVTTVANDVVAPVHPRMPVMLDAAQARLWLDWEIAPKEALTLLRPYGGAMQAHPVGRGVNGPRHDAADCIAPV